MLSASIFLTLLNATRYLEWFPKYYVLVSALAQGLPSVLRFIGAFSIEKSSFSIEESHFLIE